MAHCIDIYLGKKEEMNDPSFRYLELEQGIVAILDWPGNRSAEGYDSHQVLNGRTIARVSTDYFGGFGEQSAILYVDGQVVFEGNTDDQPHHHAPVNEALKRMGVKAATGKDEFDTIRLGNYRSNSDFDEELAHTDAEEEEQDESLSFVKAKMESEGFDYCFRHYSTFDEVKDEEFHTLRKAYVEAANRLEKYVNSRI